MSLITCADWTPDADYQIQWAPTNDPRIVAVIQRDEDASFSKELNGDAIIPVFMIERDHADHVGGYEDDESLATRIVEARDRFRYAAGYRYNGLSSNTIHKADEMTARWAWIFHGTTFNRGSYGYQGDYDMLAMNTPAFREHVGAEVEQKRTEAQEWVDSMTSEISDIANGDVYGIGYATFPERTTTEEDIDFGDFEVEIEVWGFVGDDYAQQSAGAFEGGAPELPTLMDFAA